MMVFLHLFNNRELVATLHNFFYVGELPLVNFLSRASNPVALFLILGGYGLYAVYQRGEDKHHYSRIVKLYLHYWLILFIFVSIGHFFFNADQYPGSRTDIFLNLKGLRCTWNFECWFLLPYLNSEFVISYDI